MLVAIARFRLKHRKIRPFQELVQNCESNSSLTSGSPQQWRSQNQFLSCLSSEFQVLSFVFFYWAFFTLLSRNLEFYCMLYGFGDLLYIALRSAAVVKTSFLTWLEYFTGILKYSDEADPFPQLHLKIHPTELTGPLLVSKPAALADWKQ